MARSVSTGNHLASIVKPGSLDNYPNRVTANYALGTFLNHAFGLFVDEMRDVVNLMVNSNKDRAHFLRFASSPISMSGSPAGSNTSLGDDTAESKTGSLANLITIVARRPNPLPSRVGDGTASSTAPTAPPSSPVGGPIGEVATERSEAAMPSHHREPPFPPPSPSTSPSPSNLAETRLAQLRGFQEADQDHIELLARLQQHTLLIARVLNKFDYSVYHARGELAIRSFIAAHKVSGWKKGDPPPHFSHVC